MNSNKERFSQCIIQWYESHKRDLPWRQSRDPYKIWISEIILQQTQVKQGHDYYVRFIKRFPDLKTLVEADEREVLNYWQGLGYYSRARNLYTAARQLWEQGGFTPSYETIRALKGVGDYTAAAICSFAFNMPVAVVDGNVYRVLSRCFGIDTPIDTGEGQRLFKNLAQQLLDKEHPSTYNSAIMDFGALQCTPQNPDCLFCPLTDFCLARMQGASSTLPVKKHKTKTQDCFFTYLYISDGEHIILHQRTAGIWKNMYELPLIESTTKEEWGDVTRSEALLAWTGGFTAPLLKANNIKHVLSHRTLYVKCYQLDITHLTLREKAFIYNQAQCRNCLVTAKVELEKYPLPRLVTLILEKMDLGDVTTRQPTL